MVKEKSGSEVPVESHAKTGGGSASVSLTFPGQASRVEATFNPQAGATGYPGPRRQQDPRSSRGRLDPRWRRSPRLSPRTTLSGHSIISTPFLPRLNLQGTGQLVREGLLMQGTSSRTATVTPTRTREEEENPQQDPRGIPWQRTRLRHR
jgi:hypothetical protein